MPIRFTVDEKLRVQFRTSLWKGYMRNAQLDPEVSAAVREFGVENERFTVSADPKPGGDSSPMCSPSRMWRARIAAVRRLGGSAICDNFLHFQLKQNRFRIYSLTSGRHR
jgi:hypothetical protein